MKTSRGPKAKDSLTTLLINTDEEAHEDLSLYERGGKFLTTARHFLEKIYENERRRSKYWTKSIDQADTLAGHGVHDGSASCKHYAKCTPDLVFVFPDPGLTKDHKALRRQFSRFYMLQKLLNWDIKGIFVHLWNREKPWRKVDNWQKYLCKPLDLLSDGKKERLEGLLKTVLKEKLGELEKIDKEERDESWLRRAVSWTEDTSGQEEFKIGIKAGIGLLSCLLEGQGEFKLDYYEVGDGRFAIFATWNDESLADFAEKKCYPVRIDARVLLGYDETYRQGALVPYREKASQFLLVAEENAEDAESGQPSRFFSSKDRSYLAYAFISEFVDLHSWKRLGILKACFLPHRKKTLVERLEADDTDDIFSLFRDNVLDIQRIHEYFGSQVAYYFAFCQFICYFASKVVVITLIVGLIRHFTPDLVCIGATISDDACVSGLNVDIGRVIHGLLTGFTGAIFVKLWVRRRNHFEASWKHRRPLIEFPLHPDFNGEIIANDIDRRRGAGKLWGRRKLQMRCGFFFAWLFTFCFCLLIIIFAHWHFKVRYAATLGRPNPHVVVRTMFDIWLALQVKVFRVTWQALAPRITALEHHKFEHTFNESLEVHLFAVYMVNSMCPFCYAAFVIPVLGQCSTDEAWQTLVGAFRMLILAELMTVFMDVLAPVFKVSFRLAIAEGFWAADAKDPLEGSYLDYQYRLPEYTGEDLSRDYQQLLVPLVYLFVFGQICWGVAFAAACLWLIAVLQRFVDFWKLLRLFRRPMPTEILGIGRTRLLALRIFAYFSAMTNWALISLYCAPFNRWWDRPGHSWHQSSGFIVCLSGLVVVSLITFMIESTLLFPDEDDFTKRAEKKRNYQINELIRKDNASNKSCHMTGSQSLHMWRHAYKYKETVSQGGEYFEQNPLNADCPALLARIVTPRARRMSRLSLSSAGGSMRLINEDGLPEAQTPLSRKLSLLSSACGSMSGEELFDEPILDKVGKWSDGHISGTELIWLEDGTSTSIKIIFPKVFTMMQSGQAVIGSVKDDGTLHWSNGDIWESQANSSGYPTWERGQISETTMLSSDGSTNPIKINVPRDFTMEFEGQTLNGSVKDDGKLYWSDGDVWETA